MQPASHAGKLTLHRVPRSILATLIVAVLVFAAHLFGFSEQIAEPDVAVFVERALDGLTLLAAAMGWGRLQLALSDPTKSVID